MSEKIGLMTTKIGDGVKNLDSGKVLKYGAMTTGVIVGSLVLWGACSIISLIRSLEDIGK